MSWHVRYHFSEDSSVPGVPNSPKEIRASAYRTFCSLYRGDYLDTRLITNQDESRHR